MNDTTKPAPADKPTLAASVVTKLATALQNGIDAATNAGNMLSDFLAACVGAKLPDVVPDADVNAIATAAYPDSYGAANVVKVRRSEARNIVRAHARLPEGLTALKAAKGKTGYNDTVALARRLANGETPEAAVAAMVAPGATLDPMVKLGRALKSAHKALTDSSPRSEKGKSQKTARLAAIEACAAAIGQALDK